jgi:hypothetical protein
MNQSHGLQRFSGNVNDARPASRNGRYKVTSKFYGKDYVKSSRSQCSVTNSDIQESGSVLQGTALDNLQPPV